MNLIIKYKNFIALFTVIITGTVLIILSVTSMNPIIGNWHDPDSGLYIDFISNNRVIWTDTGWESSIQGVQGKYELQNDNTLIIDWPGTPGVFTTMTGGNTWTYSVDGDILLLMNEESTYHLQRQY